MILTQEQKILLESFSKHPVFTLLQDLHNDLMKRQTIEMHSLDLDNPNDLKKVKEWQIFAKARLSFFSDTMNHINSGKIINK